MTLELTRVYHFSAAHRLENAALSPDANAALYGMCHRPHGHNYYLEVTVAGRPDPVPAVGREAPRGHLPPLRRRVFPGSNIRWIVAVKL